jgi:hypothetical protein
MRIAATILFFLFLSLINYAQSVVDVVQFYTPDNSGFDFTLLDSSPTHVLLKTDDANFSTSLGYESASEYDVNCLLLCDLDLNVIWQKNLFDGDFMDATLGDDCVYAFGVSQSESFIEGEELDFETGRFASKLDLNGNWEWMKFYPSLFKHSAWENTIETDSENNLLASVELWNYEHPASTDTLTFANEQYFCSALAMDFAICSILLKWDENGNELWSRVFDSNYPNLTIEFYVDSQDNYYISGSSDWSPEPSEFAGQEINGGRHVLSYSDSGEEQWAYYFSNQVPWFNAQVRNVIFDDDNSIYISILHNSDSVVTSEETLYLEAPVQPVIHSTIHQVNKQNGQFEELTIFGYFSPNSSILRNSSNGVYIVESPLEGFEHQFPPYTYVPDQSMLFISKNAVGQYSEPFPFYFDGGLSNFSYVGDDRIYIAIRDAIEPSGFYTNDIDYSNLDSKNYVIILDSTTDIETLSSDAKAFTIYPNPISMGALNIVTDYPYGSVKVIDLQGRTVFVSEKMVKEIPIEGFNKGTYIIQLSGGNGVIQERFVVVE